MQKTLIAFSLALAGITASPGAQAGREALNTMQMGWALYHAEQYDDAARLAREQLVADPGNVAAHSLYIHTQNQHGYLSTYPTYAAWREAAPERPERRIALAMSVASEIQEAPSRWPAGCEEVSDLLTPLRDQVYTDAWRYWALQTMLTVQEHCEVDATTMNTELAALGDQTEVARPGSVFARLAVAPISRPMLDELADMLAGHPTALRQGVTLWQQPLASKPGIQRARKVVLTAARATLGGTDAPGVQAAIEVFDAHGADRLAVQARDHLVALDSRLVPAQNAPGPETSDVLI